MSFILDALRKSEDERRRETTPTLSRAPLATARREVPLWIWFVIGLLSLALLALAIGWLRTTGSDTAPLPQPQDVAPPSIVDTPLSQPPPVIPRAPAPQTQAPTGSPLPIAELANADPSLPVYTLQFIEYNAADPAQGSAWINGTLYRPGQRIDSGPVLAEVRSDSVILTYGGAAYLLRLR